MQRSYDFQILPCTFFQQNTKQQPPNNLFQRKRITTLDLKNQIEQKSLPKISHNQNHNTTNFFNQNQFTIHHPNQKVFNQYQHQYKWISDSKNQQPNNLVTVNKRQYQNLLCTYINKNRVKQEKGLTYSVIIGKIVYDEGKILLVTADSTTIGGIKTLVVYKFAIDVGLQQFKQKEIYVKLKYKEILIMIWLMIYMNLNDQLDLEKVFVQCLERQKVQRMLF